MSENNKIQCVTEVNKQEKSESGRSMVEMLGTLAIIGVLSIGGIAGYTYAMNKSKANDILDGVSKRAIVVSQQMMLGNTDGNVMVEYAGKKIGDYEVDAGVYEGDEFMWIEVSGVEGPVCERMVGMDWKMPSSFNVNGNEATESNCNDEDNTLTFDFSGTLNNSAVSEGGGAGAPRNCWVTEDCTEDDVIYGIEEWCGGSLHMSGYCRGDEDDKIYTDCRKEGNSPIYCACLYRSGFGGDYVDVTSCLSSNFGKCMNDGGTYQCCGCQFLGVLPYEECVSMGDCP